MWRSPGRVRTWAKARVRMSHRVEQAGAGARQSCVTVVLCIPGPVSIPATFTACQGYFATWQSLSPTLMPTSPSHDCTGIYWIANNDLICSANVDPRDIFWNIWPALWCMGIRVYCIYILTGWAELDPSLRLAGRVITQPNTISIAPKVIQRLCIEYLIAHKSSYNWWHKIFSFFTF